VPTSPLERFIKQMRKDILRRGGGGLSDAQLLGRFVEQRDEAAFEALMRRHGPMVWGVCRRVLCRHQDAEDAFQVTFLVLARKAASVVPRELLANWLYGVAHRTALKARAVTARRRARERQMTDLPEPEMVQQGGSELAELLDEELSRLPDKYRVPIVLCDLEGKTRKEAARQLGWPEGTLSSRLARARTRLAKRMARHGLALSAGSLAVLWPPQAVSGGVPTSLVVSTAKIAPLVAAGEGVTAGLVSGKVAGLMQGVLKAMLLTKLKMATAAVLVFGILGMGVGARGLFFTSQAAETTNASPQSEKQTGKEPRAEAEHRGEVKKPADGLSEERKYRQRRWRISFDSRDGNDYAKQLEALGAILAIPTGEEGKYQVVRDLTKRPVKAAVEDLSKIQNLCWVESDPRNVRSLAKALGLEPAPQQIVAFIPRYIEDELLRKELAHAHDKEENIQETTFKFFHAEAGYQIKVVSQWTR
jgi:RNA polymerase sigma-70 factor (ECF subfamily)